MDPEDYRLIGSGRFVAGPGGGRRNNGIADSLKEAWLYGWQGT
jgi:hypothetical protein